MALRNHAPSLITNNSYAHNSFPVHQDELLRKLAWFISLCTNRSRHVYEWYILLNTGLTPASFHFKKGDVHIQTFGPLVSRVCSCGSRSSLAAAVAGNSDESSKRETTAKWGANTHFLGSDILQELRMIHLYGPYSVSSSYVSRDKNKHRCVKYHVPCYVLGYT